MKTSKYLFRILLFFLLIVTNGCKKDPPKTLPEVSTTEISNITSISASSGGTITDDGNSPVTSRGVCWSINENPTISDNKTSDGSGVGVFSSSITELLPGKLYYVRAYAANAVGTAYGGQLSITTTTVLPTITTNDITEVTSSSAISGGNITDDGGAPVAARGVCWSTNPNPTINDSITTNGMGIGSFVSSITALTPGTTYYLKAYATNIIGTIYGNQVIFSTPAVVPTVITAALTNITLETASCGGEVTSDGGASVTSRGVCWSTSQEPSIANNKTTNGAGTGTFVSNLTNLNQNTTYYVRAYATNSVGTGYGIQLMFKTASKISEENIIASVGGTITTTESIQLIIPANALPNNGIVTVGRTGNEPKSVPNQTLKVVGDPISISLPTTEILRPLQLSFPAPSGTIDKDTYGVFIYDGATYYPFEYTISGGIVTVIIDIINWRGTGVQTKTWQGKKILLLVEKKQPLPQDSEMGLKEATIVSGTFTSSDTKTVNSSSKILLMIHGWTGYPSSWEEFLKRIDAETNHLLYSNYWTFGYNSSLSIESNAIILANLLKSKSNNADIDIIAHSMGGLVARSMIEQHGGAQYINRLVTLGTPHKGAELAAYRDILGAFVNIIVSTDEINSYNYNTQGFRDLSPGSLFIQKMMKLSEPPKPYYVIACKNNGNGYRSYFEIPGEDDGYVSVESALGVNGSNSPTYVVTIPVIDAHLEMRRNDEIYYQVRDYLKRQEPSVTTSPISIYNSTSATVGGNVKADGGATVTERGIYYSTIIVANGTKHQIGTGTGAFSTTLSDLTPNTTYYVKAYATNSVGTSYGSIVTFKTDVTAQSPTVTTTAPSNITSNSATLGGNVTSAGSSEVLERGVVYATTQNPTTSNTKIASGSGTGTYSVNATNLTANTTYYVRAYAVNSQGVAYGSEVTFSTNITAQSPTVTTTAPANITSNSATLGGNVTSAGSSVVLERGVVYATTQNPTTSNTKIASGSGIGEFSINATNLTANQRYYIRAYAINSQGVGYGNEVNFTTEPIQQSLNITTLAPSSMALAALVLNGTIVFDESNPPNSILEKGFVLSTSQNPTINSTKIISKQSIGDYLSSFKIFVYAENLIHNQTYYVRAYAINNKGVIYGNQIKFNLALAPFPDFKVSERFIVLGETVQFTDLSSNSPTSWLWEFENNLISTVQNPVIKYPWTGSHDVRLHATNEYGNRTKWQYLYVRIDKTYNIPHNPSLSYGTVSDIEGNNYKTIQIGSQTWMAENLRTTKFNNGDPISTTDPETDISQETNPIYQWVLLGNERYASNHGRLYTWSAANDNRNVCPYGWHLPSDNEWDILVGYLGGGFVATRKLKISGSDYSWSSNEYSTNSSGFSALPSGTRGPGGTDILHTMLTCWWSSKNSNSNVSNFRILESYATAELKKGYFNGSVQVGYSIRCVKD